MLFTFDDLILETLIGAQLINRAELPKATAVIGSWNVSLFLYLLCVYLFLFLSFNR